MRSPVVLGIDQGTRSSRALLIDGHGNQLFSSRVTVSLHDRGGGCVEQDPRELLASVREVLEQTLQFAKAQKIVIGALGLATQRSGVCAWHRQTGEPVSPLISWADTRTHEMLEQIGSARSIITQKTSLPVLAHYAAGKIALLQSQFPDSEILVGTLDSFLIWHLDARRPFVTDDTMAARTMLYSLDHHGWDPHLADLFHATRLRLPRIRATLESSMSCGYAGIPVTAQIGDQQAAMLSLADYGIDCLINFGSIISILVPTGSRKVDSEGLVTSVFYSREGGTGRAFEYLIEGIINAGARVVDYLIAEKGFLKDVQEIDNCCYRSKDLKSDRQIFLPLGGTGSPEWHDNLSVIEIGDLPAGPDDHVRAAIENIGGFVIRQIDIFRQRGLLPEDPRVAVSGGLSQSRYLLEYIAECARLTLHVSDSTEATATGAAYAARKGIEECAMADLSKEFSVTVSPEGDTGSSMRYQRWLQLCEQGIRAR